MRSSLPTSRAPWAAPGFPTELALRALVVAGDAEESMIFVMDWLTRRILYLQGSSKSLFGLSIEEMGSHPDAWHRSLSSYDHATLEEMRDELVTHRVLLRIVQVTWGDGVVRPLRCNVRLVEIEGQTLLCGTLVPEMIFEGFDLPPNLMREAIEHAREGLAVTDAEGRFIYLNQVHASIFGYDSPSEMLGKSWQILYAAKEVRYISEEVFPELSARENWQGQLRSKKKDGSIMDVSVSLSRLPGGGIVCNCRDVSEQMAVARRLQQSGELFRSFLNALPIGVIIRKAGGVFEFLNDATNQWFALAGIPQIQTEALSKCLVGDPVFGGSSEIDKQVAATGVGLVFDYPFLRHPRSWTLEVEKIPLYSSAGEVAHVCTLVRDVTEQRRLEQLSGIEARRSQEHRAMQQEFISMVSHEFRTPLASIQGVHYLLGNKSKQLPLAQGEDLRRLLSLQGQALANLKELVDQVLLLNQIEHSSFQGVLPSVKVAHFLTDLIEGLNISVASGRIRIELNLPADYTAHLDSSKIRAAVENLTSNALKYSANESEVLIKVELADKGWRITVADCGIGIPEADKAKLFQPFHRANNVGPIPGTGFGLAIVQRVADLHGGTVAFSSTEGVGSEFTMTFPAEHLTPEDAAILP